MRRFAYQAERLIHRRGVDDGLSGLAAIGASRAMVMRGPVEAAVLVNASRPFRALDLG